MLGTILASVFVAAIISGVINKVFIQPRKWMKAHGEGRYGRTQIYARASERPMHEA